MLPCEGAVDAAQASALPPAAALRASGSNDCLRFRGPCGSVRHHRDVRRCAVHIAVWVSLAVATQVSGVSSRHAVNEGHIVDEDVVDTIRRLKGPVRIIRRPWVE